MLTPEQIAATRDAASHVCDAVTEYLITDIARRITEAGQLTSTAAYEIWRAQNLGLSQRQLKQELRRRYGLSRGEIRRLLTQTAEVGYRYDLDRLPFVQEMPYERNTGLQQMVKAAVKLAEDDFSNLTQTLGMVDPYGHAQPLQGAYRKSCDFAFEQVFTGAADYNTAIRQATANIAKYGVRTIDYASGVHTDLEAAVRRNIMGGLGLMQEQISQQNHDALGCDGWEISAHANSAPDHEPIQGKRYSDAAYKALNESLQRRIGTLNCGHSASGIILGVNSPQYTDAELERFRADNARGMTYAGRHYTGYEATQMMRRLEAAQRRQKRNILVDEATGDAERLQIHQTKLQMLRGQYARFSKASGLRTENERAQVAGFGRKQAAKSANTEIERLQHLDDARQARLQKDPSLALPNAENTVVEQDKFTKYLFNKENQRGYAKGVAFSSRLGYNIDNWEELRDEIKSRAALYPTRKTGDVGFGMKYEQKMILYGKKGLPANVTVGWINEGGKTRMTSAYITGVKKDDP